MAGKVTPVSVQALIILRLLSVQLVLITISATSTPQKTSPTTDTIPTSALNNISTGSAGTASSLMSSLIPPNKSELTSWFNSHVKTSKARKGDGVLDPALVTAEENVKLIKVMKDGTGDFKTLTDAIKSIPTGNTKRTIIYIGGGEYNEKITIETTKPFITFFGSPNNMPKIVFNGTARKYGTVYSATVAVESDYFMAINIIFVNSAPMPPGKGNGDQAVAMRIKGTKAAFYYCRFIGFQDTLCDDIGIHFFKNCYIEGTVDFIFGSGKSLYLNTRINAVQGKGASVITAHGRNSDAEDTGFVFAHCTITGMAKTLLGRAWHEMPRVIFAYSDMGTVVKPEGWSDDVNPQHKLNYYFGEYRSTGRGAGTTGRAKYSKTLTDEEVKTFLSFDYIKARSWLLPPPRPKV